ncbi:MFS transporter [Rhizobium leguminosarum]|nr:MFS transporter [Rhizobium ruizarguesonis]
MPYFFPLYEGMSELDYASIAVLLNIYLAANSIGSPFVGVIIDRLAPKHAALLAIAINALTFLIALFAPFFWSLAVSVAFLGATFTMGRVAFNKILIGASTDETLRRSVSIRAMLMTGGSFLGNIVAAFLADRGDATAQLAFVYAILLLGWVVSLKGSGLVQVSAKDGPPFWTLLPNAVKNRRFMLDLGRLFTALLPYGCWGTIIPKFVFDEFHDVSLLPIMYACSTVTIVGLTYVFNQGAAVWLHDRGFPKTAWPYLAAALFIVGLISIACASNVILLCLGAIAFGLGEVVFTPCMDEAVKRNSSKETSGTYIGLVQLTEGGARLLGSVFSLTIYGLFAAGSLAHLLWTTIITAFVCAILICFAVISLFQKRGDGYESDSQPDRD